MTENEAQKAPRRAQRTPSPIQGRLPEIIVGILVGCQVLIAILMGRGMFFGVDGVEYITHRGAVPDDSVSVFAPWAGHWQTFPILLFRGLFEIFGFRHYLPFVLVSILLHATTSVFMYLLLRRALESKWVAVIATTPVIVLGAGSEAFLWEGPMPIALTMCIAVVGSFLLLRSTANRTLVVVNLLLLLGVVSSGAIIGVAVFLGMITGFRAGWRRALLVAGPPLVVLGVWLLTLGRSGGRVEVAAWQWADLPEFVWHGITFAIEKATAMPGSGALVLAGLILAVMLFDDVPLVARQIAVCGIVTAMLEMALSSLAGMRLGILVTESSRYSYIALIMLTPALGVTLAGLASRITQGMRPVAVLASVALLAAYSANALALENEQHVGHGNLSRLYIGWFMGNRAALESGEAILTSEPGGDLNHGVDGKRLSHPRMLEALPTRDSTPLERLQAESQFYVGVGTQTYDLFGDTTLASTSFQQPVVSKPGCRSYLANSFEPQLTVTSSDGIEIGVTSQASQVSSSITRDGVTSDERQWRVEPGEPLHIATTAKDAILNLRFNAGGEYTICTN